MNLHAGSLFLLVVVLGSGCGKDELQGAGGSLHVSADRLEFPRTFVEFSTTAHVVVSNGSRTARKFTASTNAPFSVGASGKVNGGQDYEVAVTFAPERPGRFEGVLTFDLEGVMVTVALGGFAENADPCGPSAPCRIATFNQQTGECSERVAPDGAACSTGDECKVDQVCNGGACLGKTRVCDDGDRCTKDVCDRVRGCLSIDESGDCPLPADPCKAAYCDPALGCGIEDVPDGTPCGPGDCVKASICWTGECREVDVPDGTPCFGDCGMGACANKECKRNEGLVVKQRWSRTMQAGVSLIFPGLADPSGNLYWFECGGSCELVSVEPKGHVRFRVPVPGGRVEREAQAILAEGRVVVLAGTTVSAYAWFDGEVIFRQDLRPWLDQVAGVPPAQGAGCPCEWTAGSLAADGEGGIWAWLQGSNGSGVIPGTDMVLPEVRPGVLLSLSAESGETRRSRLFPDVTDATDLVVDRAGNAFFSVVPEGGGERLRISIGLDGDQRWSEPSPFGAVPVAAVGEVVFESRARAVRGETGLLFYDLPSLGSGATASFVAGTLDGWVMSAGTEGVKVAGFQPATGQVVTNLTIAHEGVPVDWTYPVLTSRSGALFAITYPEEAAGPVRPETVVREVVPDGSVARSCLLPGRSTYGGRTVLRSGAWTVISREASGGFDTVNQFDLPKLDSARSGWLNARGSLSADGRPQ